MRIDLSQSAASEIASESSTKSLGVQNKPASGAASGGDQAISIRDSVSVSSLVNRAMESPEVRTDKVASLQQAIGSGQYKLDPNAIASSMIDEMA